MDSFPPTDERLGLGLGKAVTRTVSSHARNARVIRELSSKRKGLSQEGLALCLEAPELKNWETEKLWERKWPTERQFFELSGHGVPLPLIHCTGLATVILDILADRKLRGMASLKMVMRLYREGVVWGEQMTWPMASSVLKALARLKKVRSKQ